MSFYFLTFSANYSLLPSDCNCY